MPQEFKLPDLGENIEEGDVLAILVTVGDTVTVDQPLIEMETGKATLEIPSTFDGVIREVLVQEGDKAAIGKAVLTFDANGGSGATAAPAEPAAVTEAEPSPAEPVAEPPEPAPPAPAAPETATPPASAPSPVPPSSGRVAVAAAPSVRKFARELGVEIASVRGTGPGGRISIDNVKAFTKQIVQTGGGGPAVSLPTLPDFARWGEIERTRMSGIRRATAEHMARCWATVPHVTQNDKADITHIEGLRKRWGRRAEEAGTKLTPTAIHVKVAASALRAFPQFNASLDIGNGEIILKKYIHIGVAVDTPRGLVVPVLRNADRKNVLEISAELNDIAARAREGKLGLEDMQGGTFTVSNLGGIGGSHFTPIVNFPEVAILGIGRASQEPVFQEGAFVARLLMPISLSYDHRLIDGADGARFIRWICDALEEPLLLALEG